MKIALENVRIAFVDNLWEPGRPPNLPNAPVAYSCRFIIEPGSENDKRLLAAFDQVAAKEFKGRKDFIMNEIRFNKNCNCYLPGDRYVKTDGTVYDGFAGKMSLSARRRQLDGPPKVIDRNNTDVSQASGVVYSGCFVDALVEPFAYANKPNSGLSCGLLTVRFRAHGDSFGGASAPTTEGLPPIDNGFDDEEM